MAVYRLQCSFGADEAFARDRMVITPHFNNTGGIFTDTDLDSLTSDLATALMGWCQTPAREVKVVAYAAEGVAPHPPLAEATVNPLVTPAGDVPREVALCLSFYAGQNTPRRRGRLYLPAQFLKTEGNVGLRPILAQRTKVGNLAQIFADLGGVDVDWSVWSRADQEAHAVSNWWVDDEWDTIRSRGMRATTRSAGTVGE